MVKTPFDEQIANELKWDLKYMQARQKQRQDYAERLRELEVIWQQEEALRLASGEPQQMASGRSGTPSSPASKRTHRSRSSPALSLAGSLAVDARDTAPGTRKSHRSTSSSRIASRPNTGSRSLL